MFKKHFYKYSCFLSDVTFCYRMTFKHFSKCSFHIQTLFGVRTDCNALNICYGYVVRNVLLLLGSLSHELSLFSRCEARGICVQSRCAALLNILEEWRGSDGGPAARPKGGGNSDSVKGSDVTKQTSLYCASSLNINQTCFTSTWEAVLFMTLGPTRRSVVQCVGKTWCCKEIELRFSAFQALNNTAKVMNRCGTWALNDTLK